MLTFESDASGDDAAMIDAMRRMLVETLRLGSFAWLCRWNVEGAGAAVAELELRAQADELSAAGDEIAAHMRGLGAVVGTNGPHGVCEGAASLHDFWSPGSLFEALAARHEEVRRTLRTAADIAEAEADCGSLHLIGARARAHERHLWRCRRVARV